MLKNHFINTLRELIFLTLSNHLPRLNWFDEIRYYFLKLAGMNITGKCIIWGPLTIRPIGSIGNIYIGNGTFLNTETRFGCPKAPVIIGKNVQIGPRVSFETVSHNLILNANNGRGGCSKPIIIEDNVWIGAGATILQNVTIGNSSVVAAGSVVTKNVAPFSLVGGVPAKLIKNIQTKSN